MKLLASFLKREHNFGPTVFNEALYAMYHLPLLLGYGSNSNIHSSGLSSERRQSSNVGAAPGVWDVGIALAMYYHSRPRRGEGT
ncbi:hypothetical protein GGU10DRAFT_402271 [Lentinula aff. detonsa]|uniref:Uncharacterized protein n=1 Tax=Lentinula aff. detonsa TaxID=2804958 RepID=A0AA38NMR4_9AGAR|nr:hypothetical protein GGU10DRAFT_402271 [Lentinula aff. detonsa]